MVDISAAIKQAVYDYLTEHSSPVAELFEARINGMANKALDGQNRRIGQLETDIVAWAQQVESTRSRVRELAELAEEFESHNFARRVEEVLKDVICVADYIDWEYVSRNEIDVETLAERMDFAQMMRETVEELEFRVTVR